jgi:hypothetical protein
MIRPIDPQPAKTVTTVAHDATCAPSRTSVDRPAPDAWRLFCEACLLLGWLDDLPAPTPSRSHQPELPGAEPPAVLLSGEIPEADWTAAGHVALRRLRTAGVCLLDAWPTSTRAALAARLGRRFYLAHGSQLAARRRPVVALVSSRLGRHGSHLPIWPRVIDQALRWHDRRGRTIALAASTPLAELAQPLLQLLPVQQLLLQPPAMTPAPITEKGAERATETTTQTANKRATEAAEREAHVVGWLAEQLSTLHAALVDNSDKLPTGWRDALHISPAWQPATAEWESWPLQDRLAFCLADEIHVITARSGGNIAHLIDATLHGHPDSLSTDSLGAHAGVAPNRPRIFLTILGDEVGELDGNQRSGGCAAHVARWLAQGAVGWYLPCNPLPLYHLGCHGFEPPRSRALLQPRMQYAPELLGDTLDSGAVGKLLVHCVRGLSGPLPEESHDEFVRRAWLSGAIEANHPLLTLCRILSDRRLVATTLNKRGSVRCVSFSAVPLGELIARRSFQSHLSRWDWEPYGVLVRESALRALGARPVIYGDQQLFNGLPLEDQAFYQPARRRLGKRPQADWDQEQEWRVPQDVDLRQLPLGDVVVFVARAAQAVQLARHCPWPVTYLSAD